MSQSAEGGESQAAVAEGSARTATIHGNRPSAKTLAFGALNGIAVIALYFVVDYTSPLYPPTYALQDAAIFRLVGKVWAQGGVPYADIWDHKGPLIFFVNMLGAALGDPIQGVFYVNLVIVAAAALLLWRVTVVAMPRSSTLARLLAFWFTLAMFAAFLFGVWDLSETTCFPFLAASLWMALRDVAGHRFMPGKSEETSPHGSAFRVSMFRVSMVDAYVQGLAFAACFLTRLTNAIVVVTVVLALVVMLALRRRWVELLRCVAMFIAGFATLTVPFVVYFAMHGAFGDFMYGTLWFNLSYTQGSNFLSYGRKALLLLSLPIIITVAAIISMVRRKTADAVYVIVALSGVLSIILFSRLEPFTHYYTVLLFLLPVTLSTLGELIADRRILNLAMAAFLVVVPLGTNLLIHQFFPYQREEFSSPTVERIARRSHGSVALYNVDAMAYLRYDIKPVYPLAVLQDWQASFSVDYQHRLRGMYAHPRTEYLIVNVNPWHPRFVIQHELDTKYRLVERTHEDDLGELLVYQAKDWR